MTHDYVSWTAGRRKPFFCKFSAQISLNGNIINCVLKTSCWPWAFIWYQGRPGRVSKTGPGIFRNSVQFQFIQSLNSHIILQCLQLQPYRSPCSASVSCPHQASKNKIHKNIKNSDFLQMTPPSSSFLLTLPQPLPPHSCHPNAGSQLTHLGEVRWNYTEI